MPGSVGEAGTLGLYEQSRIERTVAVAPSAGRKPAGKCCIRKTRRRWPLPDEVEIR